MAEIFDLMELEVNIPSTDFGTYTTHLSAPPKFGKSTWCTYFEQPLILDFEQGTAGKVVYRVPVSKWAEVKKYIKQLTKEPKLKEKYKTICFDTTNYALESCKQWCIDEYQSKNLDKVIDTFNKIPYGQGWEMLFKEFKAEINKLKLAGYGVVFISHIKDKVFDKETESEHTKTVPDLSDRERNLINAMCDFLLLGDFELEVVQPAIKDGNGKVKKEAVVKTNRILFLRTNEEAEAGFRWDDCPEKIPFDFDKLKNVFEVAVNKEILKGKEKFNLSDKKMELIRQRLDELAEADAEEMFNENAKQYEAEESKAKLQAKVNEIMEVAKEKRAEGIKVSVIKEIVPDPSKVQTIEEAERIIDAIKQLQIIK